jgi:DNA invertase Pin-like site-specific DNA recombinase
LEKTYSDEGLSGTKKKNRKAFLRMLEDAEEKKFDYLLVKDISRLARNIIDSIETIRFLKRHIQKVIFINQPNLTDDEFVLGIMGLIAQQESENMSKRVKFGKRINMEKGKVPNVVYGYDKVPGDYFNMPINEKEADVVRRIFNYYTQGGYGCSTIANMLNDEGIMTKKGAKWQQISVARILKNPIYIGKVINGKQEMVEIYSYDRKNIPKGNWYISERPEFAMINEATFNEAQRILGGRHDAFTNSNQRNSNKHLFSTLIKCGECGSSFRRLQVRNLSKSAKWGCSNRNYYGVEACSNVQFVKEEELIGAIQNYLCDLYRNRTDMIKWTTDEFKKLYSQNILSVRSKKSIEKDLTELKTKYERQVSMCEKGLISFEEFEKRSYEVKSKMEKLEYDLLYSDNTLEMENTLNTLLSNLFKDIDVTLSAEVFTNQMLKKIIDYIEVFPDGSVKIYMKILSNFNRKMDIPVPNCNFGT